MGHIRGDSRDQELLLPDSLEEYVSENNPVRFIEGFVDKLNRAERYGASRTRTSSIGSAAAWENKHRGTTVEKVFAV